MLPLFSLLLLLLLLLAVRLTTVHTTTFTFANRCDATVWPGTLTNAGSPPLNPTGFELQAGQTLSFQAPTGWSGRFWARTGCSFDSAGLGSCATGDCGSGRVECGGAGAAPPATLAEFTLAGPASGLDFYDVSLVDGYNLPMMVEPGSGGCGSTGCSVDLNQRCPAELRVGDGETGACRSACEAFGKPEFCCSGEYGSPATCQPTFYSQIFKSACPKSYSYAYDDASSTFTCTGGDYTVTFCPDSTTSQKSTMSYSSDNDPPPLIDPPPITTAAAAGGGAAEGEMMEDDSWLASLAIGDASSSIMITTFLPQFSLLIVAAATFACTLLILEPF